MTRPRARRGRARAGHAPLPVLVVVLGALGACAVVLPLLGLGTRVGWSDLPAVLSSDSARTALWLSLRTCLVATVLSAVLGVPLALLLARQWPGVRVARVLAVLPMTMPPVVAGIALLSTLGRRGLLGPVLEAAGVRVPFTTAAVVIAQVFVSMPFLVVTLEAALRSREGREEMVARTLGAGPWTVLIRVTLPLVGPALARGTALALGRSLGEFGATIAFAGSREGVTRTMPLAIYLERESDTATSLALAVVLIALSFIVVGSTSVRWTALLRRAVPPATGGEDGSEGGDGGAAPGTGDDGALEGDAAGTCRSRGGDVHVSFRLPERDVEVTLDVGAGRTLALVGPNGSGKSTSCLVLAGLLDATDGQVRVGGRTVDSPEVLVPAGRREVALLSQSPGLFRHMSVLDNVAFGPRCHGAGRAAARERARAELAAVGAARLASRSGGDLSGGQAARVALARALATDPRVLVLDEPTAALDVTARAEVRRLIARRAREEGLTVVLVTHDVLDITALADDVVVLEQGRVVERGTVTEVLSSPATGFTARLAGTSVLTGTLTGSETSPALVLADGGRVTGRPGVDWAGSGAGAPGLALVPPEAVALYPEAPARDASGGSPRNTLSVRVAGLERSGALITVDLVTPGGQRLASVVTAGALAELGLREGTAVRAVIKAVQVRVVPARG